LWNQGNALARRHERLNGRKLAAAKDNARMKIVSAAKANGVITEAVIFL